MKVTKSKQRSAIWMLLVGSAVCAVFLLSKAQKPSGVPNSRQSQTDDFDLHLASGRLIVHSPAHPLRLGEKNPIEITLKDPHVLCLEYGYREGFPGFGDDEDDGGRGCTPVQRRLGGSTYIDVVPTELGKKKLHFEVAFADHAVEQETVQVTVVPSHPPLRLYVGTNVQIVGAPIEYFTVGEYEKIRVEADFAGLDLPDIPVPVPDKDVKYRVIQTKGEPAIRFDSSTGEIDAERLGDALIEISYAGARQTYCVMVRERSGYSPGKCEKLRRGSDGMLPMPQGTEF